MIRNSKIIAVLICLIWLVPEKVSAQLTSQFNQFMTYTPVVNYSTASAYEGIHGVAHYSTQWVGVSGSPERYGFAFSVPMNNHSVGVTLLNDKIGVHSNTFLTLNYAFRKELKKEVFLSFAVSPIIQSRTSDFTSSQSIELNDPLLLNNVTSGVAPNLNVGGYYASRKFGFGTSLVNLMHNNLVVSGSEVGFKNDFDVPRVALIIHSDYTFKLFNKGYLQFSGLAKDEFGAAIHFNMNVLWRDESEKFEFGGSIRSNSEIVALAGIQLFEYLKLSYAYQFTFFGKPSLKSSSHDLMLVFNVTKKNKMSKIITPRF